MGYELKKDALYRQLRNDIYSGRYKTGEKLPCELEFAEQLNASFITLRAALKLLEEDGLISRIRSKGTFVNELPKTEKSDRKQVVLLAFPPNEVKGTANNIFNRELMAGAFEQSLIEGCEVKQYLPLKPEELMDSYLNGEFAGIIWDRPKDVDTVIEQLQKAGAAQVLINRKIGNIPYVACDYPAAIRQAMRSLRGIGHKHIGLVDFACGAPVFCERRDVFMTQLHLNGISDPERYVIKLGDLPKSERFQTISEKMRLLPELTAAIVSNVYIEAFEQYLIDAQIAVPRELSVLQWGECEAFERRSGKPYGILTEPRSQVGRRALELILFQLNGRDCSGEESLIDGELIMKNGCISPASLLKALS